MGRNSAPRSLSPAMSPLPAGLALRYPGLQRQRVQHPAHLALQRLVDDLVLLDPGFAAERLRNHGRGIVVAIAGQIADRHLGIGYRRLDHRFDIVGVHRHSGMSPLRRFESWPVSAPRGTPELSVDALLRHALSHYIPPPILAKPLASHCAITAG